MGERIVYAVGPEFERGLRQWDAEIEQGRLRTVKAEAGTLAGFVELADNHVVFLKCFTTRGWFSGVVERLRGSRAVRSLAAARILSIAGFARPTPYAALELTRLGSLARSLLISEPLSKARTFSRFLDRDLRCCDPWWRRSVLRAVATEIGRMHGCGIFTSDLQETNLMLEQTEDGLKIYFVDLDGFRQLRHAHWRYRIRNLVQLDRSIGRFLNRSERLRFLYDYLGQHPGRAAARGLIIRLFKESQRKERQYSRRRRRRSKSAAGTAPVSIHGR